MKVIFYLLIATFIITSPAFSQNIDNAVYKTYKRINYVSLPDSIKILMKTTAACGQINADPSQYNDYKSNYDEGFIIDLNDDNIPEYIFSCIAPSHGPGIGNIFSKVNGKWEIIFSGFSIYINDDPKVCITVLKTKSGGFHDILREFSEKKILRFVNGSYNEVLKTKSSKK